MCGICGITGSDDKNLIKKMTNIMPHRGPDDDGYYFDENISLGHKRLSIIDLKSGKQPIHNEDQSLWIVFNGEIYNYLQLRNSLEKKGHRFYTNTDTETIIHSYEEYGNDFVKVLRGAFAFAIYDTEKKKLILARDRLGIKPLYYSIHNENFYFASEIKSLLENEELERKICLDSLNQFITFRYVTGSKTLFENIYKIPAGHILEYSNKDIKIFKYWDLKENIEYKNEEYFYKNLRKLLELSVKKRLMSDVPLGVYLSGGLDSSSITAMMSKYTDEPIKSFSVGFGEGLPNELDYAKTAANHFQTDHLEIDVELNDTIKNLPKIIWHLDEPIGDPAVVPTYFISELAKKSVSVVLTGEGSDELFTGYLRYKMMLNIQKYADFIPDFIKKNIIRNLTNLLPNSSNLKKSLSFFQYPNEINRYLSVISLFDDNEAIKVSKFKFKKEIGAETIKRYFEKINSRFLLNRILYHDIKTVLAEDFLMKLDKMTMAKSVEGRVPFLDKEIAEFSMTIPPNLKLNKYNEKYVLKRAMKDIIPKVILKRKKRGYDVPIDAWFKSDLKDVLLNYMEESNECRKYFDFEYIKKIIYRQNRASNKYNVNWYNSLKLWSLLSFFVWYDVYFNQNQKFYL